MNNKIQLRICFKKYCQNIRVLICNNAKIKKSLSAVTTLLSLRNRFPKSWSIYRQWMGNQSNKPFSKFARPGLPLYYILVDNADSIQWRLKQQVSSIQYSKRNSKDRKLGKKLQNQKCLSIAYLQRSLVKVINKSWHSTPEPCTPTNASPVGY